MRLIRNLAAAGIVAASLACGRSEVPPLETQSVSPPQAAATPERVQGCLTAGEASGTFVLAAGAADTRATAVTYQLLGEPETFRPHVGKRVEVAGTIVAQQSVESRGARFPAEEKAKGTSGTPTVQSTTEIELKRLQVSGVTPVSDSCDGK